MAQPKIFVSHSHEDDAFAERLVADLRAAGALVWSDTSIDAVTAGADWLTAVEAAISSANWFVQILTNSAPTRRVSQQIDIAIRLEQNRIIKGIAFIPMGSSLTQTPPSTWTNYPFYFAGGNYHATLVETANTIGLAPPPVETVEQWNPMPVIYRGDDKASLTESSVFISYRRDDSSGYAGRLHADLSNRYGTNRVFMDLKIEPGADFITTLDDAVSTCAVLLAVIGRFWLSRRLDDPNDFVRIEIVAALGQDIRVIPILVHSARMPGVDELPDNLKPLARRQAVELTDSRWSYDCGKLTDTLDRIVGYSK